MTASRATLILNNPPGGRADFIAAVREALPRGAYFEFGGGLGDVINLSAQSEIFHRLDLGERVVLVLITHNPNSWEIFGFHPNADKLVILSLPISEIGSGYNRLDTGFRSRHGLPPSHKDPVVELRYGFRPYPTPEDLEEIRSVPNRFAVVAPTASCGPTDPRSLPSSIIRACTETLCSEGLVPVFVGRSYRIDNKHRPVVHVENPAPRIPGVVSMVNRLTAAGNARLIQRAVLSIACDSAMGCAARAMHRPTFNLVGDKMWSSCGGAADGHASMLHPDFHYCSFKAYTDGLLRSFIRRFIKP